MKVKRSLLGSLLIFLIIIPSIFAVSEDEIRQAIEQDPKLYRIYHNDPEKLIALVEERPQIWDAYLWKKEHPYSFDIHPATEEEEMTLVKNVFLSGIKRGAIRVKLDESKVPSSLKNARLNVDLGYGETVGVVLKNGQVQTLQYGALKDYTASTIVSDTLIKSFVEGSFDLKKAVEKKQLSFLKQDKTVFELGKKSSAKKSSLVGKAIEVPTSSNGSQGLLGIIVMASIMVLAFFAYRKKTKKKMKG